MKKPSLIVAIPAFNEEKSIGNMLESLLAQDQSSFALQRIVVYSDHSSDKTHQIVRSYAKKHSFVSLKSDTRRLGKYLRMNQMFRDCDSDILIMLDADIKLADKNFLNTFTESIRSDRGAMMVQAHQIFMKPKGFIANVIFANFRLWDYVRWSIPECNHPTNFYASAIAFRGSFARTVHVPVDLKDPHFFLYLVSAKKNGFRYCMNAKIWQRSISTIQDFKKLLNRSLGKPDPMIEQMFQIKTEKVYAVDFRYKVLGLLKALWHEPLFTPLAVLFNILMQKIPVHRTVDTNAVWQMLESTKKSVT